MLHQQALVVVYMSYFVRQIFLWGCSFPHDSVWFCEAITLPKPQAPNLFSFNTTLHTGKNTASVRLNDWLQIWNGSHDDYCTRTPQEWGVPLVLGVWHHQTSLWWLTGAELEFSGSSAGALDRISRPLIPHTVPCGPGRRLPFISNPLLTRTSYCHVVSWGSCHGEQSPPSQTTLY